MLVVLKFVGPHNPRGATSEESPSKSALHVLSYARFLACAVRTEVQHPRRHTRNTHAHTRVQQPCKAVRNYVPTPPPPRKTVRETPLTNPVGVGRTSRVPTSTRVCSKEKLQALALWVVHVRVNKLRCAEHNLGTAQSCYFCYCKTDVHGTHVQLVSAWIALFTEGFSADSGGLDPCERGRVGPFACGSWTHPCFCGLNSATPIMAQTLTPNTNPR